MSLTQLNIHHLRNIATARLTLHPRYNIFHGVNGSGKTSVLEAIYLLSRGHSFRTRETAPLITHSESTLTVFARTSEEDSISIQKNLSGSTHVKLNQQCCQRSSDLAQFLPCQIFYQDIFQIIDAGPTVRRNVFDWGLFHVKQSYHALWKDYHRVLKQRNALLRQKATPQQYIPWDTMLVELAYALDTLRAEYFQAWSEMFQVFLGQLTTTPCSIHYYKGWDRKNSGKSLAIILKDQFASDCQRQYTHSGAHQADILFDSAELKAKQTLSRGQQKIILIALKLAQAQLLAKPCLYLFDDLTAELDAAHVQRVMECIGQLTGQFFMTTIELERLSAIVTESDVAIFKLELGVVTD